MIFFWEAWFTLEWSKDISQWFWLGRVVQRWVFPNASTTSYTLEPLEQYPAKNYASQKRCLPELRGTKVSQILVKLWMNPMLREVPIRSMGRLYIYLHELLIIYGFLSEYTIVPSILWGANGCHFSKMQWVDAVSWVLLGAPIPILWGTQLAMMKVIRSPMKMKITIQIWPWQWLQRTGFWSCWDILTGQNQMEHVGVGCAGDVGSIYRLYKFNP